MLKKASQFSSLVGGPATSAGRPSKNWGALILSLVLGKFFLIYVGMGPTFPTH